MKKAAGPNGPTVKKTLRRNAEGLMKYILKHQKKTRRSRRANGYVLCISSLPNAA